ncbi:MAG: poly(hydroxyalkanoate) granule-associated protein [Chloroflexaceae bacterium]|nr:poly(hydroxyalkanoate) granule-associated protein [Chloroflexaceae bacterium]
MTEEVEVNVRHIEDDSDAAPETTPFGEMMRRLVLAGIGAVALTYDEIERLTARMVERGELAQKDGDKLLREAMERLKQNQATAQEETVQPEDMPMRPGETAFEQMLNRLNIPSKRDIDELSFRVAQLTAQLEELRREQDTAR